MRCFVVMGVAGCGKSTIGAALAARLGAIYLDGDDLHPPANIAKMSAGQPLTDADRAPWLDKVGEILAQSPGTCLVGCSALKRRYRDRIRAAASEPVGFLHLAGSRHAIETRMQQRKGHFMPVSLLESQFRDLEPLEGDEAGITVDIDRPMKLVVQSLFDHLSE